MIECKFLTSGFAAKMLFRLVKCSAGHKWSVSAPSKAVGTLIPTMTNNQINQLEFGDSNFFYSDVSRKLILIITRNEPWISSAEIGPGCNTIAARTQSNFASFTTAIPEIKTEIIYNRLPISSCLLPRKMSQSAAISWGSTYYMIEMPYHPSKTLLPL